MSLYSGLAYGRASFDDASGWRLDLPSPQKIFRLSKLLTLIKIDRVPARLKPQTDGRPLFADGLDLSL